MQGEPITYLANVRELAERILVTVVRMMYVIPYREIEKMTKEANEGRKEENLFLGLFICRKCSHAMSSVNTRPVPLLAKCKSSVDVQINPYLRHPKIKI